MLRFNFLYIFSISISIKKLISFKFLHYLALGNKNLHSFIKRYFNKNKNILIKTRPVIEKHINIL